MAKLDVWHIEDFAFGDRRPVGVVRQEGKLRGRVDKSTDEPRARDAINLGFFTRYPFHWRRLPRRAASLIWTAGRGSSRRLGDSEGARKRHCQQAKRGLDHGLIKPGEPVFDVQSPRRRREGL